MILRDARGVVTDHGPLRARLAGYAGALVVYHRPPEKPQVHYGDPNAARKRLRGEHMLDRKRPKCGVIAKRIQRRRTKGWRMPEGAVYVGRPSRWGNPYYVPRHGDAATVVAMYRSLWQTYYQHWIEPLRGRDLVCWCPLDQPCHADVLLELAAC